MEKVDSMQLQILVNEAVFKRGYTIEQTLKALKGRFNGKDIKEAWLKASCEVLM
jgi:hypothetical protein